MSSVTEVTLAYGYGYYGYPFGMGPTVQQYKEGTVPLIW